MNKTLLCMNNSVVEVMHASVVTVGMQDTVQRVEEVLNERNLSSVPVIDPARQDCFGIISLKDISHFHATKKNPKAVLAWEICTYRPLTATPETPVGEVGRMMTEHHIHHVVIVEDGLLKGIVSSLDIIGACLESCGWLEENGK